MKPLLHTHTKHHRLRVARPVAVVAPWLALRPAARAPAVSAAGLQLDAVGAVGGDDGWAAAWGAVEEDEVFNVGWWVEGGQDGGCGLFVGDKDSGRGGDVRGGDRSSWVGSGLG